MHWEEGSAFPEVPRAASPTPKHTPATAARGLRQELHEGNGVRQASCKVVAMNLEKPEVTAPMDGNRSERKPLKDLQRISRKV